MYQLQYEVRGRVMPQSGNQFDIDFVTRILGVWIRRYARRGMLVDPSQDGMNLTVTDPKNGDEVFKATVFKSAPTTAESLATFVAKSEMTLN